MEADAVSVADEPVVLATVRLLSGINAEMLEEEERAS
jgi:hypothetical protein